MTRTPDLLSIARLIAVSVLTVLSSGQLWAVPIPDHVVIVIEENHGLDSIIGNPDAPFLNALAASGASMANMFALTHPSQPNYIQFFSGSNQGVTDNTAPATGTPFSTPNLGAGLIAAGATFVGYSEDLPSAGSTVASSGDYWRKHNPWVNWQSSTPGPNQLSPFLNQPFSTFPTDFNLLPKVSIVVPNQQNDMHDGTIAQGDAWLVNHIKPYADWAQTHNSLLVITWDEDASSSRNRIPTILSGPMVTPGVNNTTWTLHNIARTVGDMYGASPAGSIADVRPMVGMFTTDPLVATRTFQQGINGYTAAHDTFVEQSNPNATHGGDATMVADGSPLSQGLVRFDSLFGNGSGQVPAGATILSAKLVALSSDSSVNNMSLHAMKVAWNESSTWNSLVAGITADDTEAASQPDFRLLPNQSDNYAIFDVTSTVQGWALDPSKNFGWFINPSGTDGWRWQSSEGPTPGDRPYLEITFKVPEPSGVVLATLALVGLAAASRKRRKFDRRSWPCYLRAA